MNMFLLSAGILSIAVGLIHSVLGEVLIFRYLRNGTMIPTIGKPLLRERNIRILWATWHIATVFGWAFGAILLQLSLIEIEHGITQNIVQFVAYTMIAAAALVFIATKARHPGWIGLLGVAVLCWLA